jgi:hypothetical protein
MTINLNNVETQRNRTPIPDGVYCLKARVIPGGAGSDGMLRRAKNGRQLMLELEYRVVGGEYEERKFWDYVTVDLDESTNGDLPPIDVEQRKKLQISVRLGLVRLRAIIDSAFRLDPNDRGAEAEKKRSFGSHDYFDGLQFWAQVVEKPAEGKYGPSNQIDFIIVPGDPAYPEEAKAVAPRRKWGNDLDDEITF